jgi:hypothetical protein
MPYLIDSNCLIDAMNKHYAIDVCPGFWDWLDEQNEAGSVFSVKKVAEEVARKGGEVAKWVRRKGDKFFLPAHRDTPQNMQSISLWLFSGEVNFSPRKRAKFLNGADPIIIAQAMSLGYIVVTEETRIEVQPRTSQPCDVKIPNVCDHFGVKSKTLVDLIRATKATFVLK